MKQLSLIILGLALSVTAWCQPQNSTWYFGHYAGMKFDTAGNPTVLLDGALTSKNNATALSDSSGNILLYSDGARVFNANHQMVLHGDSLYSHWLNGAYGYYGVLSEYSSILLPSFESSDVYVLFTANKFDQILQGNFKSGLVMNKISLSGDSVILPKNQMIYYAPNDTDDLSENILAIRHANGRDWWLVTHKLYSDNFWTYLYDPFGIHGPYLQQIGQYYTSFAWGGVTISSPTGDKIMSVKQTGVIDVFDFNRCTGQLSNYVELGFPPYINANTVRPVFGDFSQSGNTVYVSDGKDVYQYDLSAVNPKLTETIVFSESYYNTSLPADTFTGVGGIKLGMDDKIYIAKYNGSYANYPVFSPNPRLKYLSVINHPDSLGAACGFAYNGFHLGGRYSTGSLPNTPYFLPVLIGSGCDTLVPPIALFNSQQTEVCSNGCVTFTNQTQSVGNTISYHWSFLGGTPSTSIDITPNVCYPNSGSYDVMLISTNPFGSDTMVVSHYITVSANPNVAIVPIQDSLQATQGFASYQWSLNGNALVEMSSTIPLQGSGTYSVTVTDANGCTSQISYVVTSVDALVETEFTFHPNPASNQVVCSWNNGNIESIELYDVLGRKVLEQKIVDTYEAVLDISMLNSGVYTLRAIDKNKNALVRKLVVE